MRLLRKTWLICSMKLLSFGKFEHCLSLQQFWVCSICFHFIILSVEVFPACNYKLLWCLWIHWNCWEIQLRKGFKLSAQMTWGQLTPWMERTKEPHCFWIPSSVRRTKFLINQTICAVCLTSFILVFLRYIVNQNWYAKICIIETF